jgi:hypothetical protein
MYLGEAGDEDPDGFPGLLPHSMEVRLHAVLLVRAGKVVRHFLQEHAKQYFYKVDQHQRVSTK